MEDRDREVLATKQVVNKQASRGIRTDTVYVCGAEYPIHQGDREKTRVGQQMGSLSE